MSAPLGDVAQMNAMMSAQNVDSLSQELSSLKKALEKDREGDRDQYKNTLSNAK